jgi:hypothetical protein
VLFYLYSDDTAALRDQSRSDAAQHAVHEWIVCRCFLNAPHVAAWLNLNSTRTRADP